MTFAFTPMQSSVWESLRARLRFNDHLNGSIVWVGEHFKRAADPVETHVMCNRFS
jgi:hypothetical protein